MTFGNFLYTIILFPLVQIIEIAFMIFDKLFDNTGIAVLGVSLAVTILCLPLYIVAEHWQQVERDTQAKLKPMAEHIKKTFKGDERYMMLSTYYRENNYHPIMALRSSFGLFIQIPFFMAAYSFLSKLPALQEQSFLFIRDMGQQDATFMIGSFPVNILPIAMTVINLVSGMIYSKNHEKSEKIQIYITAAIFLVLLYNSPAGLVFYWTMNNVFSLVKNVFYKMKNPKKVLYIMCCCLAMIFIISPFTLLKDKHIIYKLFALFVGFIIPAAPFIIQFCNIKIDIAFESPDSNKLLLGLFIFSAAILTILAGLYIPSTLINSEIQQFCYVEQYKSPWIFLITPFFQAFGFFIFWPVCFYFLFSKRIKKYLAIVFTVFSFSAIINALFFGGKYGPMDQTLFFMTPQVFIPTFIQFLINALVLLTTAILLIFIFHKKPIILFYFSMAIVLCFSFIGLKNIISISSAYKKMPVPVSIQKIDPIFSLSKDGKNVIVIMEDTLFTPYVEQAFEEEPGLKDTYSGFTFYKNTVSLGRWTMVGTPGLFGGYEYTPYLMNKRKDETLQKKHNEAILSMPVLFDQNGWNVAVSDLPYENYLEYPVTTIYDDYPYIKRYVTEGVYSDFWCRQNNIELKNNTGNLIKRNFIWFSFFKISPPVFRKFIYSNEYHNYDYSVDAINLMIKRYAPMEYLSDFFDNKSDKDSFVIFVNELAHDGYFLEYPDYKLVENVTNKGNGKYANESGYHTATASLLKIGNLINKLKSENLYDNTRIIIVSDHGTMEHNDVLDFDPGYNCYPSRLTATLLVKDFNSNDELTKSMEFMTNADTPTIATKDIFTDAKNPFTGNKFEVENKNDYIYITSAEAESTRNRHNTQFDVPEEDWITVKDNIYIESNWKRAFKD